MKIWKHNEWAGTQQILHMISQMMGKVKLANMHAQPEWNQVLLYPTAQGFTTGLIPYGDKSFDIILNINSSMVYTHCTDGGMAGFPLMDNASVSSYYADFTTMLKNIGCETAINPKPQEVAMVTPFDQQREKIEYDPDKAKDYFETSIFARNALLEFASPFRGKKILPAFFWGTFDMTTVLFSGKDSPFQGQGIIGEVAFDEQFVEFGYWPGDKLVPDPTFFIMPYPFLDEDLTGEPVSPAEAIFSPAKKEFFLKLEDAMKYDNPHAVVVEFCKDAFAAVAKVQKWERCDWFTKPLPV